MKQIHRREPCRNSPVGCAAAYPAPWFSTWATSLRVTTFPHLTTTDPTRGTRSRCGCVRNADSLSSSMTRRTPKSRGEWNPRRWSRNQRRGAPYHLGGMAPPRQDNRGVRKPPWRFVARTHHRPGLRLAGDNETADVVVDCFGLMHWRDQAAAISERANRVAPGGVLLLQYHELRAIVRQGQWNMLRLGHYAYYSFTALDRMLARVGFTLRTAWTFDLYGGTVLLAATRGGSPDESVVPDSR